jgi:hypothetical protein
MQIYSRSSCFVITYWKAHVYLNTYFILELYPAVIRPGLNCDCIIKAITALSIKLQWQHRLHLSLLSSDIFWMVT